MDRKKIEVKDKFLLPKLIKVVPFDTSKNKTHPHKHNGYLELVFLSSAAGKHVVDGRTTVVKSPCLLIIRKDNVHHWDLVNPVEGFVLLVKDKFVEHSMDFEIQRLVSEISRFDIIYFQESNPLKSLMEMLSMETNKICQEGLFKVILAKAIECTESLRRSRATQENIYTRFCDLLSQDVRVVNHVAYYASKLNTSSQNLNSVCRKNTNLTASGVLAGYIIKEAQRQLFYTTNTISEVAFALGFSDKSNFSKYFKRHSGITPKEFRSQQS